MGDSYDERGVTYIGPRALVLGFMLYCAGFMALVYGANRISESSEAREPVAAFVTGPPMPVATAVPSLARSFHSAVQALPRAHARTAAPNCGPVPLCTVRPVQKVRAAIRPATKPAVPLSVAKPVSASVRAAHAPANSIAALVSAPIHAVFPRRAPIPSVPARPAAPAARAVPVAPAVRATPQAQAVRGPAAQTPATPARPTSAALLVPFASSAAGLRSSGGLDPRTSAHATLMVGPTRGLGPNPAATAFGGTLSPQPR